MLLQIAGDEAVIAQLPNYLTDPAFAGKADKNPFHSKEDDNALTPMRGQRRYRRRKDHEFKRLSETEALKRELKEAVEAAKKAAEEAQKARKELQKFQNRDQQSQPLSDESVLELFRRKARIDKSEEET